MAEILLRPLRGEEVSAAIALEARATAYPWSEGNLRDSLSDQHPAWVLEQAGVLLGYAVQCLVLDEATLLNIAVEPNAQGRGLGWRLLQQVLNSARDSGAVVCFLEVRVSNAPAIALYQRAGFSEVGRRKRYYAAADGREDALVMRCDLGAATRMST